MRSIGNVLYEYLQEVQSLLAPGIASVFLLGVFWKRATAKGGLWGLIIGFALGMFRLIIKVITTEWIVPENVKIMAETQKDAVSNWLASMAANPVGLNWLQALCVKFMHLNWLHYCVILFGISLAVIFIVSQFTKKPTRNMLDGLTYGSASKEQIAETRASWNKWDVINSLIIVGVIVAFYAYFW